MRARLGTVFSELRSATGEPWRRNLLILWFAQFVAMVGMSGCLPFLPLYVPELGVAREDVPLWSGLIMAAPFMTSSLLTPVWGAMGDKYGQKLMVMRAVAGLGITMSLMGFATNIWTLFFLRLLQGAVSGFIASTNAFVSTQTPTEKTGTALATLQTSISAGNIIGPLIGGAISDALGYRTVFFFVGLLCFTSLVIIAVRVREDTSVLGGRRSMGVGRTVRIAARDSRLRRSFLVVFLAQCSIVLASPIFPYYLEQLGAPAALLSSLSGTIVSIVGICVIISAPWWGARSDRHGHRRTITVAGLVVAIGQLLQSIVPTYEWLFPLRAIIGLASGAIVPLTYAELTRHVPQDRRGGIMGLASSVTLAGNLTGPLLCGLVTMVAPLETVFLFQGLIMLTAVWVVRRT